jgi:hypothetical protein
MTGRKPPRVSWESWVDRQIREGIERGEFDDLPGTGRPLADLDGPHDELWWVRKKMRDEQVEYLPPTLAIRKELDLTLAQIAASRSEAEVVRLITAINERIVYINSHATPGPPSTVMALDPDRLLADWRATR